MFQPTRGRGGGPLTRRGPGVKLMISNLDYGVSTADIKVVCLCVGAWTNY